MLSRGTNPSPTKTKDHPYGWSFVLAEAEGCMPLFCQVKRGERGGFPRSPRLGCCCFWVYRGQLVVAAGRYVALKVGSRTVPCAFGTEEVSPCFVKEQLFDRLGVLLPVPVNYSTILLLVMLLPLGYSHSSYS